MRVLLSLFILLQSAMPASAGKLDLDLISPFAPRGLAPRETVTASWGSFRFESGPSAARRDGTGPYQEAFVWTGQMSLAAAGLAASLGGPPGLIAGFGLVTLFQAARGALLWRGRKSSRD